MLMLFQDYTPDILFLELAGSKFLFIWLAERGRRERVRLERRAQRTEWWKTQLISILFLLHKRCSRQFPEEDIVISALGVAGRKTGDGSQRFRPNKSDPNAEMVLIGPGVDG
ncbi:hypothetical protein GWI33_004875 [Rhynchophorus ferrugineus]|uniref:Uncharacterized protein n=1 Tax=Rhynchophorus ferrugineus TaxID=354439 RepID=A0A834IIB2_RHYFE|nr:hypothetical protein GWI33_004875 [Rhynchophorus ferrugineus]